MIENKIKQLNQKVNDLLKKSKSGPKALEPLLDKLLDSLNVETAAAVENANRVTDLDALKGLGERLSSAATSTIDSILKIVYEQTSLLMGTKNFYVAFHDAELNMVSFPFVRENGEPKKQLGDWAPRKTGRGLTEYIIRNREPLYISNNVDNWYLDHQDDVIRQGRPAKSWLGVPMITRAELIGVITVQDYDNENVFDANDLSVLSVIANQAAIAISNARLFQSSQRQADEALQLRKVSQAITSTIDLSKVLKQVVQGARKVMNSDLVVLYPITQGKFEPATTDGKTLVKHEFDDLPRPDGLASKVLKQGFLSVDDLEVRPEMISKFVREEKIRSVAGITLKVGGEIVDEEIVGGEPVGVLYFNFRQPQTFGETKRNTIHLFAAQAATAIQNARLFDRRDKEFKAIERINRAITTQIQEDWTLDKYNEPCLKNEQGGTLTTQ